MCIKRIMALAVAICGISLITPTAPTRAAVLSFSSSDFGLTTTFNNVATFDFEIEIVDDIVAGVSYVNPAITRIDYSVMGSLTSPTPSGFPAFSLVRSIVGNEFYSQGSSMAFTVSAMADLSDGLQVDELTGLDPIFEFHAREVGTGRYHPPRFRLNADGTGRIENSNNTGGVNPGNGMVVDVDFGEEYITELAFNPAQLTIAAVPEPGSAFALTIGSVCSVVLRRRR
tara:strand:- start:6520 stop:7203 length:684 start_codon:yes stop_codon:yes gene_type:complete